ncbi:hypothetical protein NAL32_04670 [Chryseobacterium sp. Ch-15]|uniref:Uncharacterized protein n=1 Tax=Chryseobacterium muglaense TaxID=2893752 RepID=A0A9Q3UTK7_9FLAO|nr:hypothetical protein [Chryseobacterium muglaense]MBD3904034.1 hypothetical protein [Chryseobacterium muglaense]MCC9032780.1 hypothetical protein [Chryseobacterium muglaense]MCM2553683.1 hypothetical protein [Chryseobacterium muglaense]
MFNPTRRNRNIGTENQGFSQNNKLKISTPYGTLKSFYERIEKYQTEIRMINGHEFLFIIEETRENCFHSCSVNDLAKIIQYIPKEDYGDLRFIILRQPKRKEEIISPVWGRLVYSFEFENEYFPAIILDSIDLNKRLVWSKKQTIEDQKEFILLKEDGHLFIENKRDFISELKLNPSRNTQLYRTLLHEFGHYVHYLEVVERPGTNDAKEIRDDYYMSLPKVEKEKFAHQYTNRLKKKLTDDKIIPFENM